ncbi:acyl-[acyl-carrier-protein] thioesterase [Lactococcus petauri]|uniref:acyl-[acyl-carrier-protein] thioesterase n=1 Tax=Lactococcus petauri TaxID=1940789 RepID=UPI00254E1E2A|nr:acyl-[acyl-carrier-protein] thioesterase [Lactococcus petauri]
MGIKYSQTHKVAFYESDTRGKMKISDLLAVALQISGEQSYTLDRSDTWICDNFNLFWAVIEHEVQVHRLPEFNDQITIETEATSYNKFFCYRDFIFKNTAGETLVKISSTWVLMNKDTRKVERVVDEIVAPYEAPKVSKIIRPHKYLALSDQAQCSLAFPIRFSDLDMNGHVNNAKYFDWAVDQLDYDFRMAYEPKKIYIRYNHELLYGNHEFIHPVFEFQGDTTCHIIRKDGVDNANIEIEWSKISEENERK